MKELKEFMNTKVAADWCSLIRCSHNFVFFCEFGEICKNTYLHRAQPVAACASRAFFNKFTVSVALNGH